MGLFNNYRVDKSINTATRSDPIDTNVQSVDPLISMPVGIKGGELADNLNTRGNRYALIDGLYKSDERLYSTIELMAVMITKSIGDISIAGIRNDDDELTTEEKNAIKVANKFAKDIKLKKQFYQKTIGLWKYGDTIDLIKLNSKGIIKLQSLPMQHITAVDKRSQVDNTIDFGDELIQDPKFYIVNEGFGIVDIKSQVFKKERILHISFNPDDNLIRDNKARWTYGVWSTSPVNSLIAILQWKANLIRNDMLWSNKSVPREVHTLDLSQFSIDHFPGTVEQKLASSKVAVERAIDGYTENQRRREADQGYVKGNSVAIEYLEPQTASYLDPSGKLDQINSLIGSPMGAPGGLVGGDTKGFTSIVHASSFLAMRAEIYAAPIQLAFEDLIKRHVGIVRPGIRKSVVDRLYIKNRLILDRDRAELAKMISVLAPTGTMTINDMRKIWGLDAATKEEMKMIKEFMKMKSPAAAKPTQSKRGLTSGQEDLSRKKSDSPTGDQESNEKRKNDRFQSGDK